MEMIMYFDVLSDLTVIGFNPENADISNPRGEIIGLVFYVTLTFNSGCRYTHVNRYLNEDEAYLFRQECEDTFGSMDVKDTDFDCGIAWEKTHSVYGSDDYREHDTIEWEREQENRYCY